MPSVFSMLSIGDKGSLIQTNNQLARIVLPPIQKTAEVSDNNDQNTPSTFLAAESGKCYLLQGHMISAIQGAGNTCTGVQLQYYDYFTGGLKTMCGITLTPNVAAIEERNLFGYNVLTMPGKPVLLTRMAAAPQWNSGKIFYVEVNAP